MLDCLFGHPPRGPCWTHKIKQEGYRLCRKDSAAAALWTRRENEVSGRFSRIFAMLRFLPVTRCTIDDEVIVRWPNGHADGRDLRREPL